MSQKELQVTGELTVSTSDEPTQPPPETPDMGWERLRFWAPRIWVGGLSLLVVIAGALLFFGRWPSDGAEPQDVLLFAVVAAAIAILPNLKTFKFGDVTVELRNLHRRVSQIEKNTTNLPTTDGTLAEIKGDLVKVFEELQAIQKQLPGG